MPNSHAEVYLHYVWSTYNRLPYITASIRTELYKCLAQRCIDIQTHLLAVGGVEDHVHILVRMPSTITIAEVAQNLKGVSSYFIANVLEVSDFRWQKAYGVFSVSPENLDTIINYIKNQETHHSAKTAKPYWEPE